MAQSSPAPAQDDRALPLSIKPPVEDSEVERPSGSLRAVGRDVVVLAIDDDELRRRVGAVLTRAGRVVTNEDSLAIAAVVVVHGVRDAAHAIGKIRARGRSDAAIIALLDESSRDQTAAAHRAGAFACAHAPVIEDELLALVAAAIDAQASRTHVADLSRQLDLQTHLASMGRMSAGLHHELSSPIMTASMNLELILEGAEQLSEPARSEMMAEARESRGALDRVAQLLQSMKELGRQPTSSLLSVDVVEVVREARKWAADALVDVEVEELFETDVRAFATRALLGQLVTNLTSNAGHAAGTLPSPRIRLHVYATKENVIVSVRDNGPGIAPELQDRIFEPFFTTRRDCGGTGLGLALCREYAVRMGASLSVSSALGRGACFRVVLRRA